MSYPTTTATKTHYDPHFVDMMRGTPPPTWEQTCLKLEAKLAERTFYIEELEKRLKALWDKYYSDANYYEKRMCSLIEAGNSMYDFINPPTPSMRTTRMDNLLQGWDDAKIGKEAKP